MSTQTTPTSKNQKHKTEIDIARGIGILLVVIGHALANKTEGNNNETARILYEVIYSFHMALFIFLSGLVAIKVMQISESAGRISYIIKRAKRLLVPYFVLSVLFLPVKQVMANYVNEPYQLKDIWKILLGETPNYALWTLYTLFLCSLIAIFVQNKKTLQIVILAFLCLFVLNGILKPDLPIGLRMFLGKGIYYFLGLYAGITYNKLVDFLKKKTLLVMITSIFAFSIANVMILQLSAQWRELFQFVAGIFGTLLVLCISCMIARKKENNLFHKSFRTLGIYCMDIYILGTVIQPVIRILLWTKLQLNFWIYVFVSVILILLITITISKMFIRKFNIMRKIILGMD